MSDIRQAPRIDPATVITKRADALQPGDRVVTNLWLEGQEVEEVGMRENPRMVRVWFVHFGGYTCYLPDENVLVARA